MTEPSRLPFSPVPHEATRILFRPDSDLAFTESPLRVLWHENFRSAAISLTYGSEDRARREARTGLDMETAYLSRRADEYRQRQV